MYLGSISECSNWWIVLPGLHQTQLLLDVDAILYQKGHSVVLDTVSVVLSCTIADQPEKRGLASILWYCIYSVVLHLFCGMHANIIHNMHSYLCLDAVIDMCWSLLAQVMQGHEEFDDEITLAGSGRVTPFEQVQQQLERAADSPEGTATGPASSHEPSEELPQAAAHVDPQW